MKHFRLTGVFLVAAVALAMTVTAPQTASATESHHSNLVVRTDKGLVQGAVKYGVEGFLGIPYAAPPVGNLRWTPPQPATAWKGIRQTPDYGSYCPQGIGFDSPIKAVDENCLFVNVQRPIGTKNTANLPVYVYIHGGGFQTGRGENTNKIVAQTGVIGVSMNYRLGTLGFLALPGLTKDQGQSGNYGLLDQQAALKWIQRNITQFGGDPKRVTIGGESAGGFSVCYQLVSPGSRGTFSQAMIQSGGCPWRTEASAEASGTATARSLGCTNSATVLACMRSKSVSQLVDVPTSGTGAVIGTSFMPVDPAAAIKAGKFPHIPMVVGGQRDEGRSFFQGLIGWSHDQYIAWVKASFPDHAAAVLARYPWPKNADKYTPAYLVSAVVTDSGVLLGTTNAAGKLIEPGIGGCGTRELQLEISKYTRTYAYEFAHRSGPGWVQVPGFSWGAGHATELSYLFPRHSYDSTTETQYFGWPELQLANQMVNYWGAFVKHSDPAVKGQPWWPHYKAVDLGLMLSFHAGADGTTHLITDQQYSAEHQCSFWDSISAYNS